MLVSKGKYDFLFGHYEQSAPRVDLLEHQLADLNGALKKSGDPCKYTLEYCEAAITLLSLGREPAWQTLERLALADGWVNGLLPALTRQIFIQEWQETLNICSTGYVYGMSHHQSQGET